MLDNLLKAGNHCRTLFLNRYCAAANAAIICLCQLFTAGRLVKAHYRGKQDRIRNAVRNMILAAQRIAECMHSRTTGSRNGDTGIEACDLYLNLCVHRFRIVASALNMVQQHIQCLKRVQIAERICLITGKAHNRMGECIHTGCRSNFTRQLFDHFCIQNHIVGNHIRVDDTNFQLLFRNSNNGIRRCLRTGTGSGRDH